MRTIKFRAFNKEDQKMYQCLTGLFFDDDLITAHFLSSYGDTEIVAVNDLEVMQFTGLLDKNGREIYEGDIIKRENETSIVEYDNDIASFIPFGKDDFSWDNSRCEVIGNVFENPELMEAT